jgi:DNA repair exonuclease SbcCD ATPase subunit
LQEQYDAAFTGYDMARAELDAYEHQLAAARTAKENAEWEVTKAQRAIDAHSDTVARLNGQIAGLRGAKTCPTCGQAVGKGNLDAHRAELVAQRDAAMAEMAKPISNKLKLSAAAAGKTFAALTTSGTALRDKATKASSAANLILPRLSEAEAKVAAMQRQIDLWTKEGNPYTQQWQSARASVSRCAADIEAAEKAIRVADARERRAQFWIKGFKDVRLYEIEELLQAVQLTANAMLADAGLVDWSILLDVERETAKGATKRGMQVRIASPHHSEPVNWKSWSGGERQRLRAMGALALSRSLQEHAGVDIPWLGLDEPTAHLSVEGVRDMVDTLASYAKQAGRCVWYVDHTAIKSNRFNRSVLVVNTDAGARVE